jgi:hypothetical protein
MTPEMAAELEALERAGAGLDRRYEEALTVLKSDRAVRHAERAAIAAELLQIPVEQVTHQLIGFCVGWFGRPEPLEDDPRLGAGGDVP